MSTMNITIIIPALQLPTSTASRKDTSSESPQPTTPFPPINISPSPTPTPSISNRSSCTTPASIKGSSGGLILHNQHQHPHHNNHNSNNSNNNNSISNNRNQSSPSGPADVSRIITTTTTTTTTLTRRTTSRTEKQSTLTLSRDDNSFNDESYDYYEDDAFIPLTSASESPPTRDGVVGPSRNNSFEIQSSRDHHQHQQQHHHHHRNHPTPPSLPNDLSLDVESLMHDEEVTVEEKSHPLDESTASNTEDDEENLEEEEEEVVEEEDESVDDTIIVESTLDEQVTTSVEEIIIHHSRNSVNSDTTSVESRDSRPTESNSSPETVIHVIKRSDTESAINHRSMSSSPTSEIAAVAAATTTTTTTVATAQEENNLLRHSLSAAKPELVRQVSMHECDDDDEDFPGNVEEDLEPVIVVPRRKSPELTRDARVDEEVITAVITEKADVVLNAAPSPAHHVLPLQPPTIITTPASARGARTASLHTAHHNSLSEERGDDHVQNDPSRSQEDDDPQTTPNQSQAEDHLQNTPNQSQADDHRQTTHSQSQADDNIQTTRSHSQADDHRQTTHNQSQEDDHIQTTRSHSQADDHRQTTHSQSQEDDHIQTRSQSQADDHRQTTQSQSQADDHRQTTRSQSQEDDNIQTTRSQSGPDEHVRTARSLSHEEGHIQTARSLSQEGHEIPDEDLTGPGIQEQKEVTGYDTEEPLEWSGQAEKEPVTSAAADPLESQEPAAAHETEQPTEEEVEEIKSEQPVEQPTEEVTDLAAAAEHSDVTISHSVDENTETELRVQDIHHRRQQQQPQSEQPLLMDEEPDVEKHIAKYMESHIGSQLERQEESKPSEEEQTDDGVEIYETVDDEDSKGFTENDTPEVPSGADEPLCTFNEILAPPSSKGRKRLKSVRKSRQQAKGFPNPRKPSNYPQRMNKVTLARQALAREKRRVYVEERIQSYIKNAQASNLPLGALAISTTSLAEITPFRRPDQQPPQQQQQQQLQQLQRQESVSMENTDKDMEDEEVRATKTTTTTTTKKSVKSKNVRKVRPDVRSPAATTTTTIITTPTLNELQSQLQSKSTTTHPLIGVVDANNYYLNHPISVPPPPQSLSAIQVARVQNHSHRRTPLSLPVSTSSSVLTLRSIGLPILHNPPVPDLSSPRAGSDTVRQTIFAIPPLLPPPPQAPAQPATAEHHHHAIQAVSSSSTTTQKTWKGVEHHGYFYSFRVRQSGPVQMMDKGVQTGSANITAPSPQSHSYTLSFSETHSTNSSFLVSNSTTVPESAAAAAAAAHAIVIPAPGQITQTNAGPPVTDERDKILREITETVQLRHDAELRRAELVQRANDLQMRVKEKRDKINRRHEFWHKKYIEESALTRPLEASCSSLRAELNTVHRRLLAHLEGRDLPLRLRDGPSKKANYKIMAARLQHEIKELQQKVKAAKLKLDSEIKLKEQADREVREIRNDLAHKKVVMSLARSQVSTLPAVHPRAYDPLIY